MSDTDELRRQVGELQLQLQQLRTELQSLKAAWDVEQAALAELHRRNLNTIRSLRRLAELDNQVDEQVDDDQTLELLPDSVYVPPDMKQQRRKAN